MYASVFVQEYYLVPEVTWQQSSASGDVMREIGVYIALSLSLSLSLSL